MDERQARAMDITQLVLTLGSVLGIALVGVMAVVPSVMEAEASRGGAPVPPTAPTVLRPGRRGFHHHARTSPADLAA
jgi:hypothetical protein